MGKNIPDRRKRPISAHVKNKMEAKEGTAGDVGKSRQECQVRSGLLAVVTGVDFIPYGMSSHWRTSSMHTCVCTYTRVCV